MIQGASYLRNVSSYRSWKTCPLTFPGAPVCPTAGVGLSSATNATGTGCGSGDRGGNGSVFRTFELTRFRWVERRNDGKGGWFRDLSEWRHFRRSGREYCGYRGN